MTVEYDWDTSHADKLLEDIQEALSAGSVARFFDNVVEEWLQSRVAIRFASGGDDAAGRWKPLSDATIARRVQQGFPGPEPINVRTGDLRDYITKTSGKTIEVGEEVVFQFPGVDLQGELGSKIEYAQGVTNPKNRRAVLAVNETDQTYIVESFMRHIEGGVT